MIIQDVALKDSEKFSREYVIPKGKIEKAIKQATDKLLRRMEIYGDDIETYKERLELKAGMQDHDVGFAFSPSCVAAYKVFGDETAGKIALDASEYYYNLSYSEKGGFVLRYAPAKEEEWACRTMMDTLIVKSFAKKFDPKVGFDICK